MTDYDLSPPPIAARVPSGSPGFDAVLRGGFVPGGVYIIQGAPGTGKTILGHQICFANIRAGGCALYATLLSESHARMIQALRPLSFYDPTAIAEHLYYISAFATLEETGLKGVVTLIRREVARHNSRILVLDGLLTNDRGSVSDVEFKRFVHDLQGVADSNNCTMFLLTSTRDAPVSSERTMVDGIVQLSRVVPVARALRYLEVQKFRGSDYLDGQHAIRITADGVEVCPRLEALYADPKPERPVEVQRVSSGIARLDTITSGGLPRASATLLLGPSGSGKTTLGLHFLKLASPEEPGLHFGFYETPMRLRLKAAALGLHLDPLIASNVLDLLWQPPTERILDQLGNRLIDAVRERGIRRLVVDGLGGFQDAAPALERVSRFFAALSNELRMLACTTLFSLESPQLFEPDPHTPHGGMSPVADNILLLRFTERGQRLRRLLSVHKLRDSAFDPSLHEFTITANGIDVGESLEGADDGLRGRLDR
ncbi:MAG: hypothetical protein M3Y41_13860 [Pseudomonadota bacterium]|nr:hypothetical protein [Pseudomonadota bacterium]